MSILLCSRTIMPAQQANDDFANVSWHDSYIYSLRFAIQGWDADLVLDINHIVEWICGVKRRRAIPGRPGDAHVPQRHRPEVEY